MVKSKTDRTTIRLPTELLEQIRQAAEAGGRSTNSEIVLRLRQTFAQPVDYSGLPAPHLEAHGTRGQKRSSDPALTPEEHKRIEQWIDQRVDEVLQERLREAIDQALREHFGGERK